jgi:hypothetical protein
MSAPAGGIKYTHLAALATTTIKSGEGILHSVAINTKGATANTLTLYDNTAASGTIIAVIDTTSQIQTLLYDLQFTTGLTAVVAAGTAADITISWA